jgi:palmitoyl transferase
MKKITFFILWLLSANIYATEETTNCTTGPQWLQKSCKRFVQIWNEGSPQLLFSGYAWHNRYTYDPIRVKKYNENAWGGGFAHLIVDEDGDWQALYALAFLDSHADVEPMAGYMFLKTLKLGQDTTVGAGFTAFFTARTDMYNNVPFPGALPLIGFSYKRLGLFATYIPGANDAGNVLFIFGKYALDI